MPIKKRQREAQLYPIVQTYLKKRFKCFTTAINKGTAFGRVDVIGLRDIGGNLSGMVEVIAVEVKAGNQPFNTATGQAYSYSVYAERCYLADVRSGKTPFTLEEIDIASKLSVGLLAIRPNGTVHEILASPEHNPLVKLRLELIENLKYAQCVICGSMFKRGNEASANKFVRRVLKKALSEEKGYVYWLWEVNNRKKEQYVYNYIRRYICPDCVRALYAEVNDIARTNN